jgi:hypothetical protein
MNITVFMIQKQQAAIHGEKTNINFPYLNKIKKPSKIDLLMKKVSLANENNNNI